MPVVRLLASRTRANASGRISFSASCSRYRRSSLSRASLTASAICALKKAVRSRICSSVSAWTWGSNSLISAMVGRMLFRKRSLLLPKTLVNALSKFIIALSVGGTVGILVYSRFCYAAWIRILPLTFHSCAARDSKLHAQMRASEAKGHKNQPAQNKGVVIDGGVDDAKPSYWSKSYRFGKLPPNQWFLSGTPCRTRYPGGDCRLWPGDLGLVAGRSAGPWSLRPE